MTFRGKFWLGIFSLAFLGLVFVSGPLLANPELTSAEGPDVLTQSNQAITSGLTMSIFEGMLENSDTDADVRVDTFVVGFPDASAADNIDTVALLDGSGSLEDTSSVTGTGEIELRIENGDPLSQGEQLEYEIKISADTDTTHDDEFSLELIRAIHTIDPGGPDEEVDRENFNLGSNEITVKSLVESYAEVEDGAIPRILASESADIPILHMEFAGGTKDQTARFSEVTVRFREILGTFVPGGPSGDPYGDLRSVKIVRSSSENYVEGDVENIVSYGRVSLPDTSSDQTDVYDITFDVFLEEDEFRPTTDESHYFLTISTNQGWGVQKEGQFFGFGDAWDAVIDGDSVVLSTGASNPDFSNEMIDVTDGPLYNSVKNVQAFSPVIRVGTPGIDGLYDRFFGTTINQNDGVALDYFPNRLFGFYALGPAESGSVETSLDSIKITFPETSEGFTPEDDLRSITDDKFSGISVWRNQSPFEDPGHSDQQLQLSDNTWESDTVVELEFASGQELPSPSESTSNPDENLEVNRGLLGTSIDTPGNFYVNFLVNKTETYPDTFVARIPPGEIRFDPDRSVDDSDSNVFSSNNPDPDEVVFHSAHSGTYAAQPVSCSFSQTTEDEQEVGSPSGPVAVIGLNCRDKASSVLGQRAVLRQVDLVFEDVFRDGEKTFTPDDLADLSNDPDEPSGVAIYKDASGADRNDVGEFQPDVDHRLELADIEGSSSGDSSTLRAGPASAEEDLPMARLVVSENSSDSAVPLEDSGDSQGADFFIVVNVEGAENNDVFRPSLGNPDNDGGIYPSVDFGTRSSPDSFYSRKFLSEAETDRFFGDLLTVNTLTDLRISSLTNPGESIGVGEPPRGVLGIDAADGQAGDITLDRLTATVNLFESSGNESSPSDFADLTNGPQSGLSLWIDNGNGDFHPDEDEHVPVQNTTWDEYADTAQVNLIPQEPVDVPDTSDGNYGMFLATRLSNSASVGDTFSVSIRGGDISFSTQNSASHKSDTTNIIEVGLPITLHDRTRSPFQILSKRNSPLDVLGIRAGGDVGDTETVQEIRVDFEDVNESNFSVSKLRDLSRDTSSGVSVWKDENDNGEFDPSFLEPSSMPSNSGDEVTLNFRNSSSDTEIPSTFDDQDDFFVVIRPGNMSRGDDFTLEIPTNGFRTTRYENGRSIQTNTIAYESLNVNAVTFTDTDLMNDALDATVEVDNQDTVALALAINEEVTNPTDQYEQVASKEPDQPDGSVFTFNDVNVSVTAETVGLVAKGYNDTGATGFSEKEIFTRKEIAGIDLEGRDDAELADALAADEGFGIVVFGQQGGSNTNPSDPAFDPSNDETLKIIPPRGESATMKVFNLDQQMVFERSTSTPGEAIAWGGEGLGVDEVNNGVYIVKVNSASEEKSFPVMVVK